MPEKDQGLIVKQSIDNGRVWAVHLDPVCFRIPALREIVRFQMFSEDPREIIIITRNGNLYITPNFLRDARRYYGQERSDFLDDIAHEMSRAEEVIIQIPRHPKTLNY